MNKVLVRFFVLSILFLGLSAISFPSFAVNHSECQAKGEGGTYKNCYKPPSLSYKNGHGDIFATEQAALSNFISKSTSDSNYSFWCPSGCEFNHRINDSNPGLSYGIEATDSNNPTHTPTPAGYNDTITVVANCWTGDYSIYDTDANNKYVRWCSRAPPYTGSSGANSNTASASSKIFNKEGCAVSCDPVEIKTGMLTDYKVDYQNHSPLPIVWSRIYNANSGGKLWRFNYDRSITLTVQADKLKAVINLQREDGMFLDVYGERPTVNDDWIWSPNPDGQLPTVSVASPMTAKVVTDKLLTVIKITNNEDQVETYSPQGYLVKLEDLKSNYLNFIYTNERLTKITDNAGRYLDIGYENHGIVKTGTTGEKDSNGDPITQDYLQYDSIGDVMRDEAPSYITDGVSTIAYEYQVNPTENILQLTDVAQSDGTVVTYEYQTTSQGNWLKTYDETNNIFQTYTYSGKQVRSSELGNGLDHYDYSTYHVYLPNSTEIYIGFNSNGQAESMNLPCPTCSAPQKKSITYDIAGNPISLKDFRNNIETRTYDQARSLPLTITKASGTPLAQTTTLTWDSRFRLPTQIVKPVETPNGAGTQTTDLTYDTSSNLTTWSVSVSGPSGYSATRSGSATYNSNGQMLTSTDAKGHVTTYTYDTSLNLSSVKNALNQITTLGGYDEIGNVGWIEDPNGLRTEITYNDRHNITKIKKGCSSGTGCHWESLSIVYTPFAMVEQVTDSAGQSIKYHYDSAHRLIQKDILSGTTLLGTEVLTLDNAGTITADTFKDASGNIIKKKNFTTDNLDRIKDFVDNQSKTFVSNIDYENLLTSDSDPLGHGQTYQYDTLNRLTQITLPDSNVEGAGYGVGDELKSQTDARLLTTTYAYDGFGNVVTKNSPDSGISYYVYDASNNLTSSTDARGRIISYTYDDLNRDLTETGTTSGETVVKVYDTCLHGIGRLCSVTDRTGVTSFTYDLWGRTTSKTSVMDGYTFAIGYTYDNAGQLTNITYPSGKVVSQTWTNGNVSGQSVGATPILNSVVYDAFDNLKGWTWPSGRQVVYGYDLDGRVSDISYGTTTKTISKDDAWRITGVAQTAPSYSMTYRYDSRDRLTNSSSWGSYVYDSNSNRTSYLGSLGPLSYGYGTTNNQLTSLNSATIAVDASGNILSKPSMSFTYDDWSRMRNATIGATVVDYGVNGLGERVYKHSGTDKVYYVYAGAGQLLGVYDTSGLPIEEFVYLGARPVASLRGADVYNVETDETMTPVRVLDNLNTVVWSWDAKEPFGLSQPTSMMVGSSLFKFYLRFPGQYIDEETSLFQNGFRDYDPVTGRYMEVDPLGLGAGMNVYGYVEGNPISGIDPFGLKMFVYGDRVTFDRVIADLKSRSKTARGIIEQLESSWFPYIIITHAIDKNGTAIDATLYNLVDWTTNAGVSAVCQGSDKRYYISAEVALIHELDHALNSSYSLRQKHNTNYDNDEEKRVILGAEAKVYFELNGIHNVRRYHSKGTTTVFSGDPIKNIKIEQ